MTDEEINLALERVYASMPHCSACQFWTWTDYGEDDIDVGDCSLRNCVTAWGYSCTKFDRRRPNEQ